MSGETPSVRAARARRAAGTASDFDGSRLSLARRLVKLPRTTLAASTSVTAAAITQYERGQTRPTAPVVAELSLALGVSAEFFRFGHPIPTISSSTAHFRSLRATPAAARDQALAFAELALMAAAAVEQYVDLPDVAIPDVALLSTSSPDEVATAAQETRRQLGVPDGPVSNVVRLLEAHGVLVLRAPDVMVDRRVDAFSSHAWTRPLVLLSPLKDDKARSRFDAAHELGHLVMHPDVEPGSKIVEAQAQSFAAEFLMPAAQIVDELPRRLDWQRLHAAKRRWGTSLRALVYRAHTLGVMSDGTYRRANLELTQHGNPEAGPLGLPEAPSLLGNALELLARHGITLETIAAAAQLPIEHVREVVAAGSQPRLRLNLALS